MASEAESPLKIIFLPFPTPGHMLPMADLAKTFASLQGVECTVITTPANAPLFQTSSSSSNPTFTIHTRILPFPGSQVGLPPGVENFGSITSPEMSTKLFYAISMLRKQTEDLIRELSPVDCIISDMFYPWTSNFANEIRVPRLVFQSSSIFSLCCGHSVKVHATIHDQLVEKDDHDIITLLSHPHKIEMRKSQIPEWVWKPNGYTRFMDSVKEAELKSYGILANSFSEMEKEYEEYYNKVTGLKIWSFGPVNRNNEEHVLQDSSSVEVELDSRMMSCLRWLDKKKPNSVLYVSFGSLTRFPDSQLEEIAAGLEASGHDFIWVVRRKKMEENKGQDGEEWSVEEFQKKMEESDKGFLIVEGWAPQKLILENKAIGGMVTHCGWNTILEGVSTAGVPLVTWPLFAEQFYNERLLVDVLKVGVGVGVSLWCNVNEVGSMEIVRREKVEAAVQAVMADGKGAVEMRRRAKELSEGAKRAVHKGGSSQANLVAFLDEFKANRAKAV